MQVKGYPTLKVIQNGEEAKPYRGALFSCQIGCPMLLPLQEQVLCSHTEINCVCSIAAPMRSHLLSIHPAASGSEQ